MTDSTKPFVVLRSLETGHEFITPHQVGDDPTLTSNGTPAYEVLGYVDEIWEGQALLDQIRPWAQRLQDYVDQMRARYPEMGGALDSLSELMDVGPGENGSLH